MPADTADELAALGSAAADAIPDLIRSLADESSFTRGYVPETVGGQSALALSKMGVAVSPAVPSLARLLRDDHANRLSRLAAAFALGKLGFPSVVAPLRDALSSSDRDLRAEAAQALAELGYQADALEPTSRLC
jgi:HEAT repeat protein